MWLHFILSNGKGLFKIHVLAWYNLKRPLWLHWQSCLCCFMACQQHTRCSPTSEVRGRWYICSLTPLPCKGREVCFNGPSAQAKNIKLTDHRCLNARCSSLKCFLDWYPFKTCFSLPISDFGLLMLTEDEELVTNALETVVNLALLLNLRIFSSSKPSFIKMT